jgi:2-dehydro-3-deoxygalactonokinase
VTDAIEWIAVDWGTSNLRAWPIDADGQAGRVIESDQGMSRLTPDQFAPTLEHLLSGLPLREGAPTEVIICGMAGARQGWREAPYLEAPTDLVRLADGAVRPADTPARLSVSILPGVCQRVAGEEDVMRGEETQLLGLLTLQAGFSGTVIMPGTHNKWVAIEDGRIERFSTAMTGELFEVLSTHTVLRHSLAGDRDGLGNESGMDAGLEAGLEAPERLTGLLFKTRAASLLAGRSAAWCAGYLSGLLIGTEVGGHRDWVAGQSSVPLLGSARLSSIYAKALGRLGIESQLIDATQATIAGLKAARSQERS